MKTLDEKSVEYSARLCNQSGNYTKGEIETAYVVGASESEELSTGELGSFGQALKSIQKRKTCCPARMERKRHVYFSTPGR